MSKNSTKRRAAAKKKAGARKPKKSKPAEMKGLSRADRAYMGKLLGKEQEKYRKTLDPAPFKGYKREGYTG